MTTSCLFLGLSLSLSQTGKVKSTGGQSSSKHSSWDHWDTLLALTRQCDTHMVLLECVSWLSNTIDRRNIRLINQLNLPWHTQPFCGDYSKPNQTQKTKPMYENSKHLRKPLSSLLNAPKTSKQDTTGFGFGSFGFKVLMVQSTLHNIIKSNIELSISHLIIV